MTIYHIWIGSLCRKLSPSKVNKMLPEFLKILFFGVVLKGRSGNSFVHFLDPLNLNFGVVL